MTTEALDVRYTYGVGYLGSVISSALFGVTCIQTFYYFRSNARHKDGWFVKSMVILLMLLDIAHQVIVTDILWYYLIANYAHPQALLENIVGEEVEILFNAIIAVVVEYAWVARLWILSKNRYITAVCLLLSTTHFVLNLIVPAIGWNIENLAVAAVKSRKMTVAACLVSLVTLTAITGSLCYFLWINRTGFRRSGDIINKIMMLVVASGMLTTLTVVGTTVSILAAPNDLWEFFFSVLTCKCYINAYLTSLNARESIRGSYPESKTDHQLHSMEFRSRGLTTTDANTISVVVRSETDVDDEYSTKEGSSSVGKIVHITSEV